MSVDVIETPALIFSQGSVFVEKKRMPEWFASGPAIRGDYFKNMLVIDGKRAVHVNGATRGRRIGYLGFLTWTYEVTPHVVAIEPAPPLEDIRSRVLGGLRNEVWDEDDQIEAIRAAVRDAQSFQELVAAIDV